MKPFDPLKRFRLDEKVALVTGGLGLLGTEYVKTLIGAGARVAVFDIETGRENTFFETHADRSRLLVLDVDISNRASVESACKAVADRWAAPGILVNNAAIDTPPGASVEDNGPFEEFSEEILDKTWAVNVKGMIFCCQSAGRMMATAGGGSIINISSIYGNLSPDQRMYEYRRKGGENFFKPVSYSVTKAAVLNLTRYLATYWADRNIRVNTLSLGGVFNHQDEQFLSQYCSRTPMGRMARKDEYSSAVLFLASDASSYMTGSNMIIDGGFSAW